MGKSGYFTLDSDFVGHRNGKACIKREVPDGIEKSKEKVTTVKGKYKAVALK